MIRVLQRNLLRKTVDFSEEYGEDSMLPKSDNWETERIALAGHAFDEDGPDGAGAFSNGACQGYTKRVHRAG